MIRGTVIRKTVNRAIRILRGRKKKREGRRRDQQGRGKDEEEKGEENKKERLIDYNINNSIVCTLKSHFNGGYLASLIMIFHNIIQLICTTPRKEIKRNIFVHINFLIIFEL